jgi:hypothetical protein
MATVKRSVAAVLTVGLILATGAGIAWRQTGAARRPQPPAPVFRNSRAAPAPPVPARSPGPPLPAPTGLTPEQKARRIDKISHDYDEIRTRTAADYAAAGGSFPGGLNAFLRQLALLEREKRTDLATFLAVDELEAYERGQTPAGHLVEQLLGPTSATEEQRRQVFRLQLEYEDRFSLVFDPSPVALLARERARQQVQDKIGAVLGPELFGAWLLGEGTDFPQLVAFAIEHRLPPSAAFELRQVKNDFVLQRLEASATPGISIQQVRAAQQAAGQQAEARIFAIAGPRALQAGRTGVLNWLPRR